MIIIYIKNNQKSLVLAFVFCFVSFYNSNRLLALGRVFATKTYASFPSN